jgi:hypothetical protein
VDGKRSGRHEPPIEALFRNDPLAREHALLPDTGAGGIDRRQYPFPPSFVRGACISFMSASVPDRL